MDLLRALSLFIVTDFFFRCSYYLILCSMREREADRHTAAGRKNRRLQIEIVTARCEPMKSR